MGRGTLGGYMTNRTVHNSKARHNWEVFDNADRPTFPWDDHVRNLGSFALVYPRPAIPHPWSCPRESAPDLPSPGLAKRGPDRCPDAGKYASPAFRNS